MGEDRGGRGGRGGERPRGGDGVQEALGGEEEVEREQQPVEVDKLGEHVRRVHALRLSLPALLSLPFVFSICVFSFFVFSVFSLVLFSLQ